MASWRASKGSDMSEHPLDPLPSSSEEAVCAVVAAAREILRSTEGACSPERDRLLYALARYDWWLASMDYRDRARDAIEKSIRSLRTLSTERE